MTRKKNAPLPTLAATECGFAADRYSEVRSCTFPGQAHFATAPVFGATCRLCAFWHYAANANAGLYYAETGLLKPARCSKAAELTMRKDLPRVPFYARACRYFERNAEAPEPARHVSHGRARPG